MIICFLNIKNSLELTDTKGHITFNEPINYWGLPGLAIWMMFVNDYMFFEYQKQPWVDWYKRSCCFQWNYPILRTPWPSYMNDVCKWLYAFLNIKNSLELTDTKGNITFNESIPFWGLHGLAIWIMFVNDYMFFEYPKQPWVDWYKRSYYFQWNYPILRAPWPSYMNYVCK